MKEKKGNYYVTQEQLRTIEHYKEMFDTNADFIKQLCISEKDDIVYGFELGKIHSHLRECYLNMGQLEEEIRNNKL